MKSEVYNCPSQPAGANSYLGILLPETDSAGLGGPERLRFQRAPRPADAMGTLGATGL